MISIDELRALNGHVTFHAFGVVKLRVKANEYWHFYSDKTPVVIENNIHSHPYEYESKILFGGIRHHIYNVEPTTEKTQNSYQAKIGLTRDLLTMVHDNVNVIKSAVFDTYKDDTYYISHSTLHEVELITPKCVTYLKSGPYLRKFFLVVEEGVTYTREQVLTQRATESECWEIIRYTLDDEDNC